MGQFPILQLFFNISYRQPLYRAFPATDSILRA